jgi:hypothetical protein
VALNERQKRFVEEYLIDLNPAEAYRRAGYQPVAQYTASQSAYDLLQIPEIQAEIRKAIRARSSRTRITADRVLREIALVAFSDLWDYDSERGRSQPTLPAPNEARTGAGRPQGARRGSSPAPALGPKRPLNRRRRVIPTPWGRLPYPTAQVPKNMDVSPQ